MGYIKKPSQEKKILSLLQRHKGNRVPLPKIKAIASQYNSRIWGLRHEKGHNIENRIEMVRKRNKTEKHTFFRLVNN